MNASNIHTVACVGSGVIGTSWALNFAWKGCEVRLYDIGPAPLDNARKTLQKNLEVLVDNAVIKAEDIPLIEAKILFTNDLERALSGAQFIQEAGPENYKMKQSVMENIECFAADDAIIATSTSGLLITEIAKFLRHPERLVGGHPYNPPHLIPLVEIVKGEQTPQETAQTAYDFYKWLGKEPIILNKEVSGFVSNRLQVALYREIIDLVKNGVCTLEDTDKAVLYGPGIRWGIMGPSLIFHLGAGDGGIASLLEKQIESFDIRLSEMADWKHFPTDMPEMCAKAIQAEIANRTEEEGRTIPEMTRYRDTMLIELLKMHKKL